MPEAAAQQVADVPDPGGGVRCLGERGLQVMKRYRWNWKKCLHNLAEPVTMAALVGLLIWVTYKWILLA